MATFRKEEGGGPRDYHHIVSDIYCPVVTLSEDTYARICMLDAAASSPHEDVYVEGVGGRYRAFTGVMIYQLKD